MEDSKTTRARILVVDDTEIVTDMLGDVLAQNGYYVRTAVSGKEALQQLEKEHFDIVITDIVMPDVNGLEILKAIENLETDTDVIVLTAFADIDTAVEAIKLGAKDYIVKPSNINDISSVVEKLLRDREPR